MKKLITICLIIAATFSMQAQNKEPNYEETVAYLQKMLENKYGDWFVDFSVEGKIIKSKFTEAYSSFMNVEIEVDSYSNSIITEARITTGIAENRFTTGYSVKYLDKCFISVTAKSEAERFKRAFDHLLELIKNDKSDPFGN